MLKFAFALANPRNISDLFTMFFTMLRLSYFGNKVFKYVVIYGREAANESDDDDLSSDDDDVVGVDTKVVVDDGSAAALPAAILSKLETGGHGACTDNNMLSTV